MTKPIYIRNLPLGTGMPKICVPITGAAEEEILTQVQEACVARADLLEWRVDLWEETDKKKYLEELLFKMAALRKETPLLFTIRTTHEGGQMEVDFAEYSDLNCLAAASGKVDLIDVEALWETEAKKELIAKLHGKKVPVIASNHDFAKTEEEKVLLEKFAEMEQSGADVLKLAVMPNSEEDAARLMRVVSQVTSAQTEKPVIGISMGALGAASRVSGEETGSCLTFGVVGEASAPGQLPIAELRAMLEEAHMRKTTEEQGTEE